MTKFYKKRKKQKYKFSIICATIGKYNQINKLCKSLDRQIYKNFELIICDQNKNNHNKNYIITYKNLNIKFIKTKKGISRARNKGIQLSRGEFLIFLDDDIIVERNYLNKINNLLTKKRHNIIAYKVVDLKNNTLLNYPKKNCYLSNDYQIFNSISSVSFVIDSKYRIFFTENLGLGSKNIYQSGEETDFIFKAVKKLNYKIYFDKSIRVIHLRKGRPFLSELKKNFFYGCGWSFVVKKNKLDHFIIKSFIRIFLNIGYHFLTLNLKKMSLSISTILGRIYGLIC